MNRLIAIVSFLVVTSTSAIAQPAQTSPTLQLSADEQALLVRGEISDVARIGGTAASVVFGLGTGHAIQGQWTERGWIFTFGELAGVGLLAVASSESDLDVDLTTGMAIVGVAAFMGLHVWEVVDAASAPERHNCRVRDLRRRVRALPVTAIPVVTPTHQGEGAIGGVVLSF